MRLPGFGFVSTEVFGASACGTGCRSITRSTARGMGTGGDFTATELAFSPVSCVSRNTNGYVIGADALILVGS